MDTPERSEGALTPWSPSPLTPYAAPPSWDDLRETAPPKTFSPRVVLRAIRRHWWQILAIWFIGSTALIYLAYTKVHPTYDAISLIQVEPAAKSLITAINNGSSDAFAPYLETQVILVTSPDVLSQAITDKTIKDLPRIRNSLDPELDLHKEIVVAPQRGTHLIQVKMTGESSIEVASIVRAVVKAYESKARGWTDQEVENQMITLRALQARYETTAVNLKKDLEKKMEEVGESEINKGGKDGGDSENRGSKLQITRDQYRALKMKLAEVQIERMTKEAAVTFLQNELKNRGPGTGPVVITDEMIEAQIVEEFRAAPPVVRVLEEIEKAEDRLVRLKRVVRNFASDPSVKNTQAKLADAEADHNALWQKMYPSLKQKVSRSFNPVTDATTVSQEAELRTAERLLRELKIHENLLDQQSKTVEIEYKDDNKQVVQLRSIEDKIRYNEDLLTTVNRNLEQLEYERQNGTRIRVVSEARPTRVPSSNNRYKIMAAAPVLLLLLSVGLFVLLEAKSGRVADPDDLPTRVRLGVLGVVPPLPSLQSSRVLGLRGQRDEKRRVEEFVQSLDHLRVTLCAPKAGQSKRRCVLITSACGGEGKTTLAAQLAGRCANAGLMTLLIDADLRRPSLGELLEVPEGPGLVDVLTGEASAEAAMVVIGNAGGFHLLPAGTMGLDPSRLLHGERLGQLIAQFRETFDMVIIDAPPVLAVPDALLLGRWTDGAVLAVRHDTSRFPLVERANRRLTSVGVPVLGAVVNGVRTVESNYGSYRYTPYAAAGAPDAVGEPPLE